MSCQLTKVTPIDICSVPSEYQRTIHRAFRNLQKQQDLAIEEVLREYATPKIKGEITTGKLRWRGITLGIYNGMELKTISVIQRGKQIGPTIQVDLTVNTK